jgi:2-polyprenyl-3-methyl-5-hydroxy-6-metoxy-1,4-benzoquinol methylase
MPDFSNRSSEKEILDRDDIPFEDIKQNMRELDFINTHLGGHKITIQGIKTFLLQLNQPSTKELIICEIGCGGGDNLRVIRNWCGKQNISVQLIGVDLNPHCIAYARARKENKGIEFIVSDYSIVQFQQKPDIIFSSLFCHHFTTDSLVQQFQWMKEHARLGFFINDLQRHWLAYYSISILTKLFSKSYLVKNDARLSVLRGFHRQELEALLHQSQIMKYKLKWQWAFRWLLIYNHER